MKQRKLQFKVSTLPSYILKNLLYVKAKGQV